MKIKVLLILVSIMLCACNRDDNDIPNCLQESIDTALKQELASPEATIDKYIFNRQTVYLINLQQGYADGMSTVVDKNCNVICSIGGIAGLICEGFDQAEFVETVWQDPR